jgi:hypothetical protein
MTYKSRIPQYKRETHRALAVVVKETAFEVQNLAQRYAPVDEGELEGSISAEGTAHPLTWEINVYAGHGAHVEYGTGPHIIRPRKGKYLRFVVNGKVVFAKIVRHPGTAAQPYLRPAVSQSRPRFERRIADTIKGRK